VKANREYELRVRKSGRGPALLRGPNESDHIEVVEIATGEVALFWDTQPSQTGRLARGLRADLAALDADAFIAKWRRWQAA
jgi:cytosine/adenosine deaminase-related metal-dependent hydrolase